MRIRTTNNRRRARELKQGGLFVLTTLGRARLWREMPWGRRWGDCLVIDDPHDMPATVTIQFNPAAFNLDNLDPA